MEGSELAIKTSNLSENQVLSHDCSQGSPVSFARPVFVPKIPPRLRQRGALPPTTLVPQHAAAQHISPSQLNATPGPFKETSPLSSQQEASPKASMIPMEEQVLQQQPGDSLLAPVKGSGQGEFSSQPGMRGSLKKRKNPVPLQAGELPNPGKFSRSWHRVGPQEPAHHRGILPSPQEQNYRPQQRGSSRPLFQEQALQAPVAHTSSSPGSPCTPPGAMEHVVFPPILQMKSSFLEMWLQLEGAIQSRERALLDMKAEMERALNQAKVWTDDALKEKAEMEARKAGLIENMEIISKQTEKVRSVCQGLEQISTDLSVQVAELNHLLQQVQEQQRVFKVLESLKDHPDASNDENSFMTKNLQDFEVKLATMERELVGSKQASEVLEKATLKRIGDLEEIEGGGGLPIDRANNASSNPVSSTLQLSKDTSEVFRKTKMDERASALNGDQEMLGHTAGLKQPKVEAIS